MLSATICSNVIYLRNIAYKLHPGILYVAKTMAKPQYTFTLQSLVSGKRHLKIVITTIKFPIIFMTSLEFLT